MQPLFLLLLLFRLRHQRLIRTLRAFSCERLALLMLHQWAHDESNEAWHLLRLDVICEPHRLLASDSHLLWLPASLLASQAFYACMK